MNITARSETSRCPSCGNAPIISQTKYGPRSACCDLVGWGDKPMVDAETRRLRQRFHAIFDRLWTTKPGRRAAYRALAERLGVTVPEVHGSVMDASTLPGAISTAKKMAPYG